MHVVIFESSRWGTFAPLSLGRPLFTLMTGMSTLLDKQVRHLKPDRLTLWVRPELARQTIERVVPLMSCPTAVNVPLDDEPALLVSGRAVQLSNFEYPPHEAICTDETREHIHCAFVSRPGLSPDDVFKRTDRWVKLLDLPQMMSQGRVVDALWDLIHWNEESLVEDAMALRRSEMTKSKPAGPYHMLNDAEVFLEPGVTLEPGAVLDATKGPVVIGERAIIGANSVLKGPCYIGSHTFLRPVSLIRSGTSIGSLCNIGGEVSNSIVLDNSNKAHDGYLGDSYVGKWVNLGAGTCTSNLKNTYGAVNMEIGGRTIPTGRTKLGALIGDHSKTAVLTRLTTGTYIGFYGMVASSGIAPKFVQSFQFVTDKGADPYRLEKAIEVTRRVFARRDRTLDETDENVMRYAAQAALYIENANQTQDEKR